MREYFLRRYRSSERVIFRADVPDAELAAKLDFQNWAKHNNQDESRSWKMALSFVEGYRSKCSVWHAAKRDETRLREQFNVVVSGLHELRTIAAASELEGSVFARDALHWATLLTVAPQTPRGADEAVRISARFPPREGADVLLGAFKMQRALTRKAGRPFSPARVCAEALALAWFDAYGKFPTMGAEFARLISLLDGILPDGIKDETTVKRAVTRVRKLYRERAASLWSG